MHIQDEGNYRQGVMEQDNVFRLLFDCAESAAVPPSSPPLVLLYLSLCLEFFLSAFASPKVFLKGGVSLSFSSNKHFLNSASGTSILWRSSLYF